MGQGVADGVWNRGPPFRPALAPHVDVPPQGSRFCPRCLSYVAHVLGTFDSVHARVRRVHGRRSGCELCPVGGNPQVGASVAVQVPGWNFGGTLAPCPVALGLPGCFGWNFGPGKVSRTPVCPVFAGFQIVGSR